MIVSSLSGSTRNTSDWLGKPRHGNLSIYTTLELRYMQERYRPHGHFLILNNCGYLRMCSLRSAAYNQELQIIKKYLIFFVVPLQANYVILGILAKLPLKYITSS